MNGNSDKSTQVFEKIWGKTVLSGGFTQLPNDLLRGANQLKLSTYDLAVLEHIMSVGTGYASAKAIADAQGISIGTVRKSFKYLRRIGYVRFIYKTGEANRFDLQGLVAAVRQVASDRQRAAYEEHRGVVVSDDTHTRETSTNKDSINTNEDTKDGDGYKSFLKAKERLKQKKGKPP